MVYLHFIKPLVHPQTLDSGLLELFSVTKYESSTFLVCPNNKMVFIIIIIVASYKSIIFHIQFRKSLIKVK